MDILVKEKRWMEVGEWGYIFFLFIFSPYILLKRQGRSPHELSSFGKR